MVIGVGQRASCSSSTRGLIMAGLYAGVQQNAIDSVTMSQSGNAVDFGDLPVTQNGGHALSSPTRGIIGGGYFASPVSAFVNTIQYVTIKVFTSQTLTCHSYKHLFSKFMFFRTKDI